MIAIMGLIVSFNNVYSQTRATTGSQPSVSIASQIERDEKEIKSLQDRPSLSPEQTEYIKKLYDNRSSQERSALTPEQAEYIKNLYGNRNDFRTLLEAEATRTNAKLSQADSEMTAQLERIERDFTLEEKKLADTETSIWNNYFTVFGTILTIMGVLSAIGGYLMKEIVLRNVLDVANARIKDVIGKADGSIKEVMDKADASIRERIEKTSIFEYQLRMPSLG